MKRKKVSVGSHRLGHRRTAGLVYSQRQGKEIWYEVADDRVRFQRPDDGSFTLAVAGRSGGAGVTLTAGAG